MSRIQDNISPTDRYTYPYIKAAPKHGDGIRETVMRMLAKYPDATPEQIGNQCGIQPELVARIIDADKKRKLEGY